jgi:DNA-binding transcriptional LysR family regulator
MIDLVSLSQINLNLLLSLKALLDECNVSNAAERLNITQSTMSRNLSQLRDFFDDPLLVRSGKQTILSVRAKELLPKIDEFIQSIQCMLLPSFSPDKVAKDFVIAAPDYVSDNVLHDSLTFFRSHFDKIDFTVINWDRFAKKMLIAGEIDLAISIDDNFPANMYRRVVDEDYVVCMVGQHHPLATRSQLSLEDFIAYPHVSVVTGGGWDGIISRPLHALGLKRLVKIRVPTYRLALNMVKKTDFIVVVPKHVARNSLEAHSLHLFALPFPAQTIKMSLWWHESHHTDCAHRWLREVLFPHLLNHPKHKGISAEKRSSATPVAPGLEALPACLLSPRSVVSNAG